MYSRRVASCGNSSLADVSIRNASRRMGVDVRASVSNSWYPYSEKSESEMPCTGHVEMICGGTESIRLIIRSSD